MRKLLVAVGLLFCLGAVVQAADAPKSTITFGKGTTVTVNGKPVESGYQLKQGDKVEVTGGKATWRQYTWQGARDVVIAPGGTIDVTTQVTKGFDGTTFSDVNVTGAEGPYSNFSTQTTLESLAPPPPPPNPTQNNSVVPVVSPSAP